MDAPSSAPVRRLSAVWFADIVGFTALAGTDEGAAFKLVTILQRVSRKVAEEDFGGRIVKFIGDAALAEFSSTDAAVRAAIALQESFDKEARAAGRAAELRIGVHLGEVIATPDGDIYGDGVNTASRLQGEASPGKVLISEDVWRQLRTRPEFQFQSLGEVELRGITARVAVFDVLFGARAALASAKASGAGAATIAALSAAISKTQPTSHRSRNALWAVLSLMLIGVAAAGLYTVWPATAGSAGTETGAPTPQSTAGGPAPAVPPKPPGAPGDSVPFGSEQAQTPPSTTQPADLTTPPSNQVANRATGQGSGGTPDPPAGERLGDAGRSASGDAGRGQSTETGRAAAPTTSTSSAAAADPPAAAHVADPVRERDLAVSQAIAALDTVVRAVQRGSTAELSRALPLTVGDLAEFEQVFSRVSGPVRASVLSPSVRRIDPSGAEIQFLLMMEFTDRQGAPGSVPLPLRAFVARGARGWRIDTVSLRD